MLPAEVIHTSTTARYNPEGNPVVCMEGLVVPKDRGNQRTIFRMAHNEATIELGRRLAAAYVSHVAGHKGAGRMLKRTPERAGQFWNNLAEILFAAMSGRSVNDLRFREVITKYIQ